MSVEAAMFVKPEDKEKMEEALSKLAYASISAVALFKQDRFGEVCELLEKMEGHTGRAISIIKVGKKPDAQSEALVQGVATPSQQL